jgi:hypothetical protein
MSKRLEQAAKFFIMAILLGGLGACATAADPHAMIVAPSADAAKPFPQPLLGAMCVRNVTGGEKTNPLWVSKVDNEGFNAALTSSLTGVGLAAATVDVCHYPIDVNLLGLSQPGMGFDMTVTSHVNYKVYDSAGQPFLLTTIDAPYTAKFGEAFVGVERLKKANEGAIRQSISALFDKLRDTTPK